MKLLREAQLEEWIESYADRLTQLSYTYLRDWGKAEDAVQETFIKAYRAAHQLKNLDWPYSWLAKIAINESKAMLRKVNLEVATEKLPEGKNISSEDEYLRNSCFQEIHLVIMELPEIYRTPIVLYYIQDLSTIEIAKVIGVQPGTVRVRLMRGREYLQKNLEEGELNEHRGTNSVY